MIEEREAKRIVRPLFPGFGLIEASRAAVEGRAIHQPHRHLGLRQAGLEEPNFAATEGVAEMKNFVRVWGAFDGLGIARDEQSHVDPEFPQRCG
jgi:hypothetical protein